MKKNNSYTSKWLRKYKNCWHEENSSGTTIIVLDKKDAPKIVIEDVMKINIKRGYVPNIIGDEEWDSFFDDDSL